MSRIVLFFATIGLAVVGCSVQTERPEGSSGSVAGQGAASAGGHGHAEGGGEEAGHQGGQGGATQTGTSCADQPDYASCTACFQQQMPGGQQAYLATITATLLCDNECKDVCEAQCADPAGQHDGNECTTCIQGLPSDSAAAQAFMETCRSDSECVQFISALNACPDA